LLYPLIIFGDWLAKATLRWFGIEMTRSWVDEEETDTDSQNNDNSSNNARTSVRSKIVELLKKKSDLPSDRTEEVIKSFDIGEKPARDIMIPTQDIVKLTTDDDMDKIKAKVRDGCHSRYPLYSAGYKEYLGNIYLPSMLIHYDELRQGDKQISDLISGSMTRDASISVSDLVDAFQAEEQELCMLKKDDELIGLVTFTDASEVVFGQLKDPLD
jgi:IMP dehydrogenase